MTQIITRAQAKAKGLSLYFTGKACAHGHVTERRVVGGKCLQCQKKYKVPKPPTVAEFQTLLDAEADRVTVPPRKGTPAYDLLRSMGLPDQRAAYEAEQERRQKLPYETAVKEHRAQAKADAANEKLYASTVKQIDDSFERSQGALAGDVSKQARADYAVVIAEFKRGGVAHLLVAQTLKEKEIADTLARLPIPKGAMRRVKPEAFIKFLRREQAWVREQLASA
jgi:hypothetical protein